MSTTPASGFHSVWACFSACTWIVAGCDLPRDPEGTSERVRGGVLRVGVMHHPPWTIVSDGGKQIAGIESNLVERLADELDARVEWHPAGESQLSESLQRFELDLVVGGLSESSLWANHVGLTRAYVEAPFDPCIKSGTSGAKRVGHVLAAPPGENAWMLTLEDFLRRTRLDAERLVGRTCRGVSIGNSAGGEQWR